MSTGKGTKRVRNKPALYSELKQVHKICLTPTAWDRLQKMAKANKISVSELIEHWARENN